MLVSKKQQRNVPVHDLYTSGVMSKEVPLHTQHGHRPDVLNGVHCHHPCILQRFLIPGNVPAEDLTLEDPAHNDEGNNTEHEEGHDPGVDKGDDERENESCESLYQTTDSAPCGLQKRGTPLTTS